MYKYGGGPDDPLRHSSVQLTEEDIVAMSTILVNGKYEDCSKVGLNHFCKLNPAPEAKSDFWKAKYDHEAAKKARAAAIAGRKTTRKSKKKKTASDIFQLDDVSESEDDTGASQSVEEEVTISSDSEPLPRPKPRLVTRKVRFSHPLAYLDPHFLLKKQQHESRRQARTNDDNELPSGLPKTPRKRQNEVSFTFVSCFYQ
ncbi:uncharacterized protein LOC125523276 isoform X2 [Triticum urartu]|uniref:uncharacterized protein LOC125523276 isoform X2 n=1 Tax=Triticum urartu TaxID=4572 RepID=UPI00204383F5|nr:uncharacterized protein LOC125523276 isoform X2 [Triticum urartu]